MIGDRRPHIRLGEDSRAYFCEMLKGVAPSVVLPAEVLFRKVMICPPPEAAAPIKLPVITQSEIRAVAAAPAFTTARPSLVDEIIFERSIRTWVAAELPCT